MDTRLAEIREMKGMKQAELARRIHLSRGQVANLESGTRKITLDVLRQCADALGVATIDLLLPTDAPGIPTDTEAAILTELRAFDGYDPHAILAAVKGVINACNLVQEAVKTPRNLSGSPLLAAKMAHRWNALEDSEREAAINLMDAAKEFHK